MTQVSFDAGRSSNEEIIDFSLGTLRNDISLPMYPWINTTTTKHQTNANAFVALCLVMNRFPLPAVTGTI